MNDPEREIPNDRSQMTDRKPKWPYTITETQVEWFTYHAAIRVESCVEDDGSCGLRLKLTDTRPQKASSMILSIGAVDDLHISLAKLPLLTVPMSVMEIYRKRQKWEMQRTKDRAEYERLKKIFEEG